MSAVVLGRYGWGRTTDQDGHRTYTLRCLVECSSVDDGPAIVSVATGLPRTGYPWRFGNDYDPWALCMPSLKINPHVVDTEPNKYWVTEQTFSTRPFKRCQDTAVEHPLAEPDKVSGSFVSRSTQCTKDIDGNPITSYSHEQILDIEMDESAPNVIIEQNKPILELANLSSYMHRLNDRALWGCDPRKIKLSSISWERKYYGTCSIYYTRRLEFEVNAKTWDETEILSTGSKCRKGKWDRTADPPVWVPDDVDKNDQTNFVVYTDSNHHPLNHRIFINSSGDPVTTAPDSTCYLPTKKKYSEMNFFLLGIPAVL